MSINVDLQIACAETDIPSAEVFQQWCNHILQQQNIQQAELCIRVVSAEESRSLNSQYRQKDKPTNVLSFTHDIAEKFNPEHFLGDLAICASVVIDEASQQHKSTNAHWAHMTIHGCLHLLGYDHIDDSDATIMENLEIELLQQFGFDNPYQPQAT